MLLVEDVTPEALVLHLRDSRPWGGVFTNEAGMLIGGHAFNDETRMRTGALLNKLWDGEPIRRGRVLTGPAFLFGRRCSVHLMMQGAVAEKLLGDPTLERIGTLARMLIVSPESTMGTRLFREPPPICAVELRDFGDRILELLMRRPTFLDGGDVLDPRPMTLSDAAARMWRKFHDAAERSLPPGGDFSAIQAFGAKAAEHAGRLAAVLQAYADPEAAEVSLEHMAAGIELAQHYAAEILRLQGAASVAPDLYLAARLLGWWQTRGDRRCHLAEVYQYGPGAVRDATTARRIVSVLEEHGWVRRLPAGVVLEGAPRRDAWDLVL